MAVYKDKRNGRIVWRFRGRALFLDGKTRRISGTPGVPGLYQDLAPNKAGAIEAENRARAAALHGTAGAPIGRSARGAARGSAPAAVPTIRAYAATFITEYAAENKPSERRSKQQILDGHLLPFFGDLRLDEVTVGHVKRFATEERKRCAVKTINNRLAVLSSLIGYAVENRLIADPAIRFHVDGEVKGRKVDAVPMPDVERLLAAATDQRYRVAILLAAEAGLRAGEIRGLQWGDRKGDEITIRRALDNETDEIVPPKHNKVRTVPLSERLVGELDALPRLGLWVVSRRDGMLLGYYGLLDAITLVYDRAGVAKPSKPIHCLRHTFGTESSAKGVDLSTLQELMGHEDITTTRRYVTVTDQRKRDAIKQAFGRANPVPTKPRRRLQPVEK